MKILNYLLALVLLTASSACTEINNKKLTVGMDWSKAETILAKSEVKKVKRYLSIEYPPDSDVSYYQIEERVDLVVVTDKKNKKINSLSVRFSPSYNPVKGLDIYNEIDYIIFYSESYVIKIKKTNINP